MSKFTKILDKLLNEKIQVDDLVRDYKDLFRDFSSRVITGQIDPDDPELEAFLRCCLDVYTYSQSGEVLIPDTVYDQCMQVYKEKNKTIVYADPIGKKWNFIKHKIPGVVGTIGKIYSYPELKAYFSYFPNVKTYILSPKFDGISADIEVKDFEVVSAATRYDGIYGQDITALIRNARNRGRWMLHDEKYRSGHYKCELCVATEDFNDLIKIKKYANRRSATAGIVNTPSNLDYADYVTIIPLVFYNPENRYMEYIAPGARTIDLYSPADFMDVIENMLTEIRSADFPFRVDGVVINPKISQLGGPPNENDLMDRSIAYKVNTMEGKTTIQFGYMSVGRTGKAVPCLRVDPVEVNETIVEDVSLGSYEKFLSMGLREHDEVIVYSAGDVIPQVKLPPMRTNFSNADPLKIPRICPYCGEKLERVNAEYFCTNPNCIRIITGRITNFLVKMGLQGFSDKTVELIYNAIKVDNIVDFMMLTKDQLCRIDGIGDTDANNLIAELRRLMQTPTTLPKFFGALGIEKISEKKCRKIFEQISLQDLLNPRKKDDPYYLLQSADGIGSKTAEIFTTFVNENKRFIEDLMRLFTFESEVQYKGTICFTGFRPDEETAKRIRALGFDVSDGSVTSETIALVTTSLDSQSGKMKSAMKKNVPIYLAHEIENLIKVLKKV